MGKKIKLKNINDWISLSKQVKVEILNWLHLVDLKTGETCQTNKGDIFYPFYSSGVKSKFYNKKVPKNSAGPHYLSLTNLTPNEQILAKVTLETLKKDVSLDADDPRGPIKTVTKSFHYQFFYLATGDLVGSSIWVVQEGYIVENGPSCMDTWSLNAYFDHNQKLVDRSVEMEYST